MVLTDGEWVASLKITTNPGKMETVAALNLGLSRSGFWSQFGWTLERGRGFDRFDPRLLSIKFDVELSLNGLEVSPLSHCMYIKSIQFQHKRGTTPAASVHGSDDEDEVDEEQELAELRISDK
ncbi:hypothetical protein SFRURICE_010480 [Spodoptera frugiperda]|uniref:SFRICE_018705 n=1 Tax=Spodoptera frugiperda TaxID=7108 RepID=A0A2H1WVI6_SPOFR|nr:hypothetical protein SFRURICE_010480 [Spodoptera frugiperda]